ncbi:MAG: NUDIX hydrolase [Tumebacillaceae bacterium]
MQLVVNCVIRRQQELLMLQKPRRGWWVAPGGKVEPGESLLEAVVREVREETGLTISAPRLGGVFTMLLMEEEQMVNHWMLFTYVVDAFDGTNHTHTEEGVLEWVPIQEIATRPMAEGDREFLPRLLSDNKLHTAKFWYTPEYQLLRSVFE